MKILETSVIAITVITVMVLVLTYPTMWLWNYVMPQVFGLPYISFWQTLALLFLAQIFFKDNNSR